MIALANGLHADTDDPAVARSIDRLEHDLLRYGKGVALYLDGPAPGSDCASANALAASIHLFAMTREGHARALPFVAAAEAHAACASERERMLIAGVTAWARGDGVRARRIHLAIARRWSTDLISAKICQFHQLNAGDFAGMLDCTLVLVRAQPENGFVHGMHAFALEQMGDAAAAERAGRLAVSMNDDPWAHHAVAHVLDSAGRAEEGRRWMAGHAHLWNDCSSFMYTHNWWHAALFEIEVGDHAAALDLFDARIWGVRRDCCQDQINAVSLLIRLELLGVDVNDRWADLAPHLERRVDDRANGFLDLHYAYGLARAGRDAPVDRLLGAMTHAAGRSASASRAFHQSLATAAAGMAAHARGDFAHAAAALGAVGGQAARFGGSHTQRRLIDLVRRDSLHRSAGAMKARAAR